MDDPLKQSTHPQATESPSFGTAPTARGALVRNAGPEDAAALARVAAATFPLACPPHTTPEAIATFIAQNLSEARFGEYLVDPARQLLLAELDGECEVGGQHGVGDAVAGYAMVVHGAPSDADVIDAIGADETTELSKLYVMPGHHGSGLASELMDAAIALAVTHGSPSIWLGVNQENARANRFYAKHGFEIAGAKRFLVGDRYEEDWVRVRQLVG